jgi:penicillin-binding protein 1C
VALSESLNVPAVRVLRLIGYQRASKILEMVGITLVKGRHYGDSLVLGGAEVSLWQLLKAYGILARGGMEVNPSLNPATIQSNQQILSPGATWQINQSLVNDSRLPLGLRGDGLAFKTGTSHGFRDAWLAVYNPDHTVVLWLGDPSGAPHEGLSGLKTLAVPAINVMRDLGRKTSWPGPPSDLESFKACSLSGEPIGPDCPGSKMAYRLLDKVKSHPCRIHVRRQGERFTLWPPELVAYMKRLNTKEGPGRVQVRIVSPLPQGVFKLRADNEKLPLKSEGTLSPVFWFVDDEFYQVALDGQTPVLALKPGSHRVSLVDSRNVMAQSEFEVLWPVFQKNEKDIPALNFN